MTFLINNTDKIRKADVLIIIIGDDKFRLMDVDGKLNILKTSNVTGGQPIVITPRTVNEIEVL